MLRAVRRAGGRDPPPGVVDLVPAARTLLLRVDPAEGDLAPSSARSARPGHARAPAPTPATWRCRSRYDGEDLDEVGELTGLGARGVVEAHTGQEWTVAFCGFAPGFGYSVGEDDRLHVPRRDTPRTKVPAGSVALAGEYTGVYPRESPGGWQLIGRTDAPVWDLVASPGRPCSRPGVRVRFVEALVSAGSR